MCKECFETESAPYTPGWMKKGIKIHFVSIFIIVHNTLGGKKATNKPQIHVLITDIST